MKFDYYEYTLADHWMSAIINDDYSGLGDEEEHQLKEWLNSNEMHRSHWDIDGDESFYAVDEITGLYANCMKARQCFPEH